MDSGSLRRILASARQEHLFRFADQLDPSARRHLSEQIESLDLEDIKELVETHVKEKGTIQLPGTIEPAPAYPRNPTPELVPLYADAERRGIELLREGKVGAFLVAGGQGTRLGYDGPKGEFPITPVKNKPLFQVFAEQLLAHARDSGKTIPWYIMTSDINDTPTRAFFDRHNHFGHDPANIFFFQQGMMPAFGMDGRILLNDKDSIALSPDGHGGSLRALSKSGALLDMKNRGIEHLSYFQVDNPLVHCIDPLFLGLHDITASEMSSKMIPKAGPMERVGNFVIGDGKLQVIEYSDLPENLANMRNEKGELAFNAGSIAIHALRVAFIERLNSGGRLQLPWHRAEKKVAYVGPRGEPVKPDRANAIKLEQFIFDAIPLANNPIVYETDRAEEFSPVKNAEGVDSPETARRDQVRRAARWLKEVNVEIPYEQGEPDAALEISPLLATSAQQLRTRKLTRKRINPGEMVYFGP